MTSQRWQDYFNFLPQGAVVQSFKLGDKDIVLGFNDPTHYEHEYSPFFGETIGRCANRIAQARINQLNGKSYDLAANNGANTLHGGTRGWGKRKFNGPAPVTRDGREAVEFTYRSIDGEEGFPGTVELKVWYFPAVTMADGKLEASLEMEYEVALIGEEVEETVVNVCNHSYFNITGNPTIEGTVVTLNTALHQATDSSDIPTGVIEPFPGVIANEAFELGPNEPDIDHCFIINDKPETVPIDTRQQTPKKLCQLQDPASKVLLEVHSTEPAFQFYTGKYIDVPAVDGQPARGQRSGICIEASRYVNAINDGRWRGMVVLKKGQIYGSRTIYKASQL